MGARPVNPAAPAVPILLGGLVALLLFVPGAPASADPLRRPPDPRDDLLAARAVRVGDNVVRRHLTPEGILAYIHRRDATPAQLSHDAIDQADTGIWTGCYAASVACRYHVLRDAESLALARRVAAGLALLGTVTGVEGAFARSAGHALPGEPLGKKCVPSPLGGGLHYRRDPSRDTLSGLVLGWTCLALYVDDVEVRATASSHLAAIARRLHRGGMKVRDVDGKVTTHGDIDAFVGPFQNGSHAAIGAAAILAGATFSGDPELWEAWRGLCRRGWDDAIATQHTWIGGRVTHASNLNMAHQGLVVVALLDRGKARRNARAALREFRRVTRGWSNGGYLAMGLLGEALDPDDAVPELRRALLDQPAQEIPWKGTWNVERKRVVPFASRPVNVWAWKQDPDREEVGREVAVLDPTRTFTRADFLFAYWLARAAGAFAPGPPDPHLPAPPAAR